MKVECPQCGQHYEVDSSMIGRHFRCTECKTFFLGLNAKTVKENKYKVVEQAGEGDAPAADDQQAVTPVAADAPEAPEAADKAEIAAVETSEKIAAVFSEEEMMMKTASGSAKTITLERFGVFAAILMCIFILILTLVCNSRLSDLSERCRDIRSENTALQNKLDQQERLITDLTGKLAAAEEKHGQFERWSNEVNTKLQDDSLQKKVDGQGEVLVKLEGRLADQMKTIKEQSALLNAHIDVAQTAVSANKKADNGSETDSGSRRTVKKR